MSLGIHNFETVRSSPHATPETTNPNGNNPKFRRIFSLPSSSILKQSAFWKQVPEQASLDQETGDRALVRFVFSRQYFVAACFAPADG
jgi:hypothetical protein